MVLRFIRSPELIGFGWRYIQITSCQMAKGTGRQKLPPLRVLKTNGLDLSSTCRSSAMVDRVSVQSINDIDIVWVFFETGEVCHCSLLFLSSLIKPLSPPPGMNTLPSRFKLQFPNRTHLRQYDLYISSGPS